MGANIRLARLFGIPVELNPSWFLIFFLVAWSLATQVFPAWQPGLGPLSYWAMGLVTGLTLFASLLAHELAHSLMSRRFGLEVRRITLFLFGGVSEAADEMPSPRAEFQIAAVGPLSSFMLGGLFFLAAYAAGLAAAPAALQSALTWLGVINVALAVFNLVPGFPLDGGRVLRAGIWAWTGDFEKATRWASFAGRAFAVVLIGIGVSRLFGGNWFGGFWLLFLGWLLFQAARGSYAQVALQQALGGVRVGALMNRDVRTVEAGESLAHVVESHFLKEPYGGYPVVEGGRVVGLLTRRQVQRVPNDRRPSLRVAEVMVPLARLPLLGPDDPVGERMASLADDELGRLPVVVDGALVGILSQSDVVRYLTWREARPREKG